MEGAWAERASTLSDLLHTNPASVHALSRSQSQCSLPHRTIMLITGIYLTFWHLAGVEDFELVKNKNMFAL